MSKRQWLCLLGVWVIVFPFLGFLESWKLGISVVSGLIIIAIAYNLPYEQRSSTSSESSPSTENNNKPQ